MTQATASAGMDTNGVVTGVQIADPGQWLHHRPDGTGATVTVSSRWIQNIRTVAAEPCHPTSTESVRRGLYISPVGGAA